MDNEQPQPLINPEVEIMEFWFMLRCCENIRKTIEMIERNQAIVDKIMALAKEYNVCAFEKKDGKVTCRDGEPCCAGCKHLTESGCTVSAHGCRMWFCATAWPMFPLDVQCEIHCLILQYEADIWFRHDGFRIHKEFLAHDWPNKKEFSFL